MKIDDFIIALRSAGLVPTAESVADFFFLSSFITRSKPQLESDSKIGKKRARVPAGTTAAKIPRDLAHLRDSKFAQKEKTGLYAQGQDATGFAAAAELEVPEAPALPQALELARSLRPLLKPYQMMTLGPLDEEATAERSAHLRQLILVFGRRTERWFDVALLVEDAPSMAIWSKTIKSFEQMLVELGAFRDIRRWRLNADASIADSADKPTSYSAISAADGRRILLIITQGVSTVWRSNAFGGAILAWGRRQPIAVVQLLPERLWENTTLGEPKILARSPLPGSPNSQWDLELPSWMKRRMPNGIALPILTLDAGSLGNWAQMLMGRVNSAAPSVFWSSFSTTSSGISKSDEREIVAEDRLERFRRIASDDGFRLATALSAGPVTLPVMRLINQTLFGESARQETIAQVFLGGLLRIEHDNPEPELVFFEFHVGVRELLAGLSRSEDRFEVRRQVMHYLQQHPDTTQRFRVLVPDKDGKRRLPKWAEPFADESEALLRQNGLLGEVVAPDHEPEQLGKSGLPLARKTAVVLFTLPGDNTGLIGQPVESKPLTCEREYGVRLSIDGHVFPAGFFQSPRNDEQWRDFVRRLRDCNVNRNEDGYRGAVFIRSFGADLYQKLAGLSPKLREFLGEIGTPRRLVIQTYRPELHLLPWSALYDENGKFIAAGDVSIVQAWDDFSLEPALFPADLKVLSDLRANTPKNTERALKLLPREWLREKWSDPDILHIEAHGNAVSSEIGEVGPWTIADKFAKAKIALLWSCYSSASNSWGESPALCLHRRGTAMVLSFQAELHNLDAKSIAEAFYADVFGAAASRDPESALVRIRSDKFKNEFNYAAWASMTVYLRCPLYLSLLPLNGPRVPAQGWSDASVDDSWASVTMAVGSLVPGALLVQNAPPTSFSKLPRSIFESWNGTVIRLDGDMKPLSDSCIQELGLSPSNAPTSHPAERLVWLFEEIARYGQPLIVWTNSSPRQLEFVKTIKPSATLTFLLLYEAERERSVPELVDEDQINEALERSRNEVPPSGEAGDEYWKAVYYALARSEKIDESREAIRNMSGAAERLLASGNFVSRFRQIPDADGELLSDIDKLQRQEEFYRQALDEAINDNNNPRDVARAKLELGYLLQSRGEIEAADLAYLAAAQALERTPEKSPQQPRFLRDSRWHSALGRALRDRAELLSGDPDRLTEASALLRRALAIHSYHGRTLQVAYCRTAAARIDLAAGRFDEGVRGAVDAAKRFESLTNWRAWAKATEVMLDILAETRETSRMLTLADLAIEKMAKSNLPPKQKEDQTYTFNLKVVEALLAAGDIKGARTKMEAVGTPSSPKLKAEADRLRELLAIS